MLLGTATGWPPSATSTACTVPSASASTVPSAAASTSPAAFLPFPCATAVCLPAALPSAKELICYPPPARQAFTPAAFKAFSSPPTAAKAGSGHPATGLLLPECRGRPSATEDCPGAADAPHSAPHPHQGLSGTTSCPQVPGGPASQPLAHTNQATHPQPRPQQAGPHAGPQQPFQEPDGPAGARHRPLHLSQEAEPGRCRPVQANPGQAPELAAAPFTSPSPDPSSSPPYR